MVVDPLESQLLWLWRLSHRLDLVGVGHVLHHTVPDLEITASLLVPQVRWQQIGRNRVGGLVHHCVLSIRNTEGVMSVQKRGCDCRLHNFWRSVGERGAIGVQLDFEHRQLLLVCNRQFILF